MMLIKTWESVKKGENGVDYLVGIPNIDKLPVKFGAQIKIIIQKIILIEKI